jgi:hypothetical protein
MSAESVKRPLGMRPGRPSFGPIERLQSEYFGRPRSSLRPGLCLGMDGDLFHADAESVDPKLSWTLQRKVWVESAIEAHGQRVQALPQAKLQIMNIGATGKRA